MVSEWVPGILGILGMIGTAIAWYANNQAKKKEAELEKRDEQMAMWEQLAETQKERAIMAEKRADEAQTEAQRWRELYFKKLASEQSDGD